MTAAIPPAFPLAELELDAVFKRLNLANARRVWRDLVARAEREDWPYDRFLTVLVAEEIAHRQQTRLTRLTRRAGFPFLKTIDDFDFTYQSTVRLALLGSALSPDFLTEGRALILAGKPGRGKTHLAVAIAYRAIQNGFDAHFVTAAELIDDLSAAFRQGRLADALTVYTHPGLLVVDEVGYLTYGTDAANMLFHVVNDRHKRRRAMIFTTNKPLSTWGRVLHDDDLALAIVDRILERGRLLTLDGPSMRTKHLGLEDFSATEPQAQVAKLSGIHAPEFPEPTRSKVSRGAAAPAATRPATMVTAAGSSPAMNTPVSPTAAKRVFRCTFAISAASCGWGRFNVYVDCAMGANRASPEPRSNQKTFGTFQDSQNRKHALGAHDAFRFNRLGYPFWGLTRRPIAELTPNRTAFPRPDRHTNVTRNVGGWVDVARSAEAARLLQSRVRCLRAAHWRRRRLSMPTVRRGVLRR